MTSGFNLRVETALGDDTGDRPMNCDFLRLSVDDGSHGVPVPPVRTSIVVGDR